MKRHLLLGVLVCLLPTQPMTAAEADAPPPLGRLFLTPAQRQAIDRQRQRDPASLADQSLAAGLVVNGEIRSSSGRRTRWINGSPDPDDAAPGIAVGDSWHPASGSHDGLLRGGRIIIRPAAGR